MHNTEVWQCPFKVKFWALGLPQILAQCMCSTGSIIVYINVSTDSLGVRQSGKWNIKTKE